MSTYANVDGIPFSMPVRSQGSPVLFGCFSIDAGAAAELLPGQALHPCRLLRRGVLVVAVANYLATPIGEYVEFCIGILVTKGRSRAPALAPLLVRSLFGVGVYIYDLPVSTEISVKGGLGIWGMPKRQANLDFVVAEDMVSSQYDLDGRLAMRIDVPRPAGTPLPVRATGVGYGSFRGLLSKSYVHVRGRAGLSLRRREARLLLGDHPRMSPLKALDIDPRPLVTGFIPATSGVLDDHAETWFLTSEAPVAAAPVGLRDVVELGTSEDWLDPPDRAASDRLLQRLTPGERVGRLPRAGPGMEAERGGP
ncbi:MAG: acetoacetate decarboxylase family protein [bacterium]|nr:acetoacetate decarboxylase family protein [bacterium]